ncbi:MAG: antitoxin [Candidatus Hydrogenedentes bacterium]|nr:antitoxin [Candidatus Hydrogenedentota bacterium]
MKLTEEERAILESVERGEWRSVDNAAEERRRYAAAAQATERKDKRVNIRMTERDLIRFKKKAAEDGLPYQTLVSSVLHKYINGRPPRCE